MQSGDNRRVNSNHAAPRDAATLDALTGGALGAATSSERAARVRAWLASDPPADLMQDVYRELSARDKGAAKPIRERLEEIKRQRDQDAAALDWAAKAQTLMAQPRMNIADALAWQRDAAKAGAPLSREPLAALKTQLADRVRGIEDLQHRLQVQREAALLLAQRIEVLSTRPLADAAAARDALALDVPAWLATAEQLQADAHWPSLDPKFAPQLDASRTQLHAVWDAFGAALAQAQAAAADAAVPLPSVPVWADEIRAARGAAVASAGAAGALGASAAPAPERATPAVDPAVRAQVVQAVRAALEVLEKEVAEGHGKASAGAANALRQALKDHGRLIDAKLDAQAQAAIAAATELEGWQRWSADKIRQELVAQAEGLFEVVTPKAPRAPKAPRMPNADRAGKADEAEKADSSDRADAAVTAPLAEEAASPDAPVVPLAEVVPTQVEAAPVEAPAAAPVEPVPGAHAESATGPGTTPPEAPPAKAAPTERRPRLGGRKMQEALRDLRERWKQTDQSAPPNHALWKRFDRACNEAYKVVQVWLDQVKAEAAAHRAQRMALIDEVNAWAAEHAALQAGAGVDWKAHARALHQFSERWRNAGHLSEKAFAEIQPQWKAAMQAAAAPLEAVQKLSTERRHALIDEARALGEAPMLRIDAVKALQQRWQAEAHAVPLERKHEQKLWDAFRKPIDEAFQRKGAERERAAAAMSDRDRRVLEASRALNEASKGGDAARIRTAMQALDEALRARDAAATAGVAAGANKGAAATDAATAGDASGAAAPASADEAAPADAASASALVAEPAHVPAPAPAPAPAARPVVARRGDDRPGARRPEFSPAGSGPQGRRDQRGGRDGRDGRGPGGPGDRWGDRGGDRGPRGADRRDGRDNRMDDRGPRLGDAAFRAQRDAMDHAQLALRKLAAQAHGEALTRLMSAWEHRKGDDLPSHQDLGRGVTPAVRSRWLQSVSAAPAGEASQPLLRLEMAAEVPTPAEALEARRALQLQLLTRRNDPSPRETWADDAAHVLATAHDAATARRLQAALKVLLRGV